MEGDGGAPKSFQLLAVLVLVANLLLTAASVGILCLYQAPLFSADEKLKGLDANLRSIEQHVAEQKIQLEMIKSSFGTAEGVLKLLQDFIPKIELESIGFDYEGKHITHRFSVKNQGHYGVSQQGTSTLIISRAPLTYCDHSASEPQVKNISLPPAFGLMHPNVTFIHTASYDIPSDLKDYWFCLSMTVVTNQRLVETAKKVLGGTYDSEIDDAQTSTSYIAGHIQFKKK
jgi:hypothetical protein